MARPTQFQKLSLQLDAENKKLKAKLQNTKKSMGGISSAAKKMGGAIAAAFAVGAIVKFGKEASIMAAQFEGVNAAFIKMGGQAVLGNLQKATRGTVNNLDLMKAAVQAKNFDIPLKDLAKLFEFATKRAQQTGESVDFLVKSIILGIGRKSPLILDNLGISAIRLRKELKGVGSEVSTVADVAEAVGRIAQQEMGKAGDIINTTAIRTASWGATMDNLKVTIGTGLNKVLQALAPLIDKIIKGSIEGFKWFADGVRILINEFITLFNESFAFRVVVESLGFVFKTAFGTIKAVIMSIWELLKTTKDLFIAAFTPGKSFADAIKKGFENIKNIWIGLGEDTAKAFGQGIKNIELKEKLPLLPTGENKEKLLAGAQTLGAEVKKAFNKGGQLVDLSDDLMIQQLENEELRESIDLEKTLADITASASSAAISDAKTFGQELKSIQASSIKGFISQGIAAAISQALAFIPPPFNLIAAGAAATVATGLFNKLVPQSFARGTKFVGADGMAMVHQGEEIRNKGGVIRDNNGGGQLVAVVSGSDLHFVLDRFNNNRANSL